ncbi:MAG TPA: glutaminyl-peptide cyclotransferase, partial [Phnomibacter sp.]|nr:glutaminyl-peptide cyclotransferase [Phnomibacter sp.]
MKHSHFSIAAMLLLFACSCNNRVTPETPDNPAPGTGIQEPQTLSYQVVAEYPHDTGAYTQGLLWH